MVHIVDFDDFDLKCEILKMRRWISSCWSLFNPVFDRIDWIKFVQLRSLYAESIELDESFPNHYLLSSLAGYKGRYCQPLSLHCFVRCLIELAFAGTELMPDASKNDVVVSR